jgi:hypothetical protein
MNSIISPALENKTAVVNGPKVGDILVSTYGYEACIAHWAKVVAVTKSSVKIQLLRSVDNYKDSMTWDSMPDLVSDTETVLTKRFKPCGDSYKVKDTNFSTYYLWNGEAVNCYNYH